MITYSNTRHSKYVTRMTEQNIGGIKKRDLLPIYVKPKFLHMLL